MSRSYRWVAFLTLVVKADSFHKKDNDHVGWVCYVETWTQKRKNVLTRILGELSTCIIIMWWEDLSPLSADTTQSRFWSPAFNWSISNFSLTIVKMEKPQQIHTFVMKGLDLRLLRLFNYVLFLTSNKSSGKSKSWWYLKSSKKTSFTGSTTSVNKYHHKCLKAHLYSTSKTDTETDGAFCPSPALILSMFGS